MRKCIVTLTVTLIFDAGALAVESSQSQKESPSAPPKELPEQMAKAHEKMALCLR